MRLALLTPKARQIYLDIDQESVPGVLVEGPQVVKGDEVTISNFFLPVFECSLLKYDQISFNGDEFSILNQFGVYETHKGGLALGPSEDFNDYALVFLELLSAEKVIAPRYKGPAYLRRVEFDEGKSDIFIVVLKRDLEVELYVFTHQDTINHVELTFRYAAGDIVFKCKKFH